MHARLVEVQRSFSNQLAVVSLPMPLDAACNPTVFRTSPAHTNACQYARLGLAVFQARESALEPFDDWFFAFEKPPPLEVAMNHAAQLVGGEAVLRRALGDPSIQRQVQMSIQIYETSYRRFGNGSMPQFIIGTNVATGTLATEHLRAVIERSMAGR
jgi:hypothetical protein